MLIYPNTNYQTAAKLDSPIFLAVEKEFWAWFENTNPASEYEEMYFGDEAIYSKKGAILQAIEEMIDEADTTGKPVNLKTFDIDGIFQG